MNALADQHCKPCEGGVNPLTPEAARQHLNLLHAQWQLAADAQSIQREFHFKNFYRTMSFVNAIAHIANCEDHHPDLEVGYNICKVKWYTHAIGGLSENDFICAAKIDTLDRG